MPPMVSPSSLSRHDSALQRQDAPENGALPGPGDLQAAYDTAKAGTRAGQLLQLARRELRRLRVMRGAVICDYSADLAAAWVAPLSTEPRGDARVVDLWVVICDIRTEMGVMA